MAALASAATTACTTRSAFHAVEETRAAIATARASSSASPLASAARFTSATGSGVETGVRAGGTAPVSAGARLAAYVTVTHSLPSTLVRAMCTTFGCAVSTSGPALGSRRQSSTGTKRTQSGLVGGLVDSFWSLRQRSTDPKPYASASQNTGTVPKRGAAHGGNVGAGRASPNPKGT